MIGYSHVNWETFTTSNILWVNFRGQSVKSVCLAHLGTLTMLGENLTRTHIVRVVFEWVRSIDAQVYFLRFLGRSYSLLLLLQRLLKILRTHDKCLDLSELTNICILFIHASAVVLGGSSTTLSTGIIIYLAPILQVIAWCIHLLRKLSLHIFVSFRVNMDGGMTAVTILVMSCGWLLLVLWIRSSRSSYYVCSIILANTV